MNEIPPLQRPIGYWLKRADALLTTRIDEAQQALGLTRTDWQVLNALHGTGSATIEQLGEPMRPFADPRRLSEVLEVLSKRGLLDGDATAGWRLSDSGQRLHQEALARQKQVREKAMSGIERADYAVAVQFLERLASNLEKGPDAGSPT